MTAGLLDPSRRPAAIRALLQNGWIVAGVLLLGWSGSIALGAIYLETLLSSLALRSLVRRWVGEAAALETARAAVLVGLCQGVFMLVFGLGVLRDPSGIDPIWRIAPTDLAVAASAALAGALLEYRWLRARARDAGSAWLRHRVERQSSIVTALILFMLVLPWSFFLVGERGLFVVLFAAKAGLDIWLGDEPTVKASAEPPAAAPRPAARAGPRRRRSRKGRAS